MTARAALYEGGRRGVGFGPLRVASSGPGEARRAEIGSPAAFNWYAMGLGVITIVTVFFMPETKGRNLSDDDHLELLKRAKR
jgi:hypothetical protein